MMDIWVLLTAFILFLLAVVTSGVAIYRLIQPYGMDPVLFDEDGSERWVPLIGAAHFHDNLAIIAGPVTRDGVLRRLMLRLVAEPMNPFDPNAVRADALGLPVGYLPEELAREVSLGMSRGAVSVWAEIIGGRPEFEVVMRLPEWMRLACGVEMVEVENG